MSKIEKLAEQQNAVAVAPVQLPAGWQEEMDAFRQAVARWGRPSFFGRILRFRKGEWLLGTEKEKVPDRTRFIAVMSEVRHGWLKFLVTVDEDGNEKKTPVHIVGKVVDGFVVPDRETLDERDRTKWKIGLNGKPEDPWKSVIYMPMVSPDGEMIITFTTSTPTGLSRAWGLIDRYQWIGRKYPGQDPIIELQASSYHDKRYGPVAVPDFKIVGWTKRTDPAALLAPGGSSSSTEEPPPWDGDDLGDDHWERE